MINRRAPVVALLLAQLALVGGCLNHPRNNQVQARKTATVSFDGYYLDPGQVINIYILNNVSGVYEPNSACSHRQRCGVGLGQG